METDVPYFNSNRDDNVIFRDESGNATDAQLLAFEDTWHWGPSAEATYAYLTNTARHEGRVPDKVSTIIAALRAGIGDNHVISGSPYRDARGPAAYGANLDRWRTTTSLGATPS